MKELKIEIPKKCEDCSMCRKHAYYYCNLYDYDVHEYMCGLAETPKRCKAKEVIVREEG